MGGHCVSGNILGKLRGNRGFPGGSVLKNPYANARGTGSIPSREDPQEKDIATHSSPTQESNPHLAHWQEDSLPLSQQGSPPFF